MRVVVNGAGIAGPTLAYWLRRSGHEVTIVEQSERPRRGGYVVDFWGVGYDIAEKMGVLPRVRALGYQVREKISRPQTRRFENVWLRWLRSCNARLTTTRRRS